MRHNAARMTFSFVMTGGGTGGHVIPALAVARVLHERGHRVLFIGTKDGMEARLVPEAGFEIEFIRSGGLKRVSLLKRLQTAARLPLGLAASSAILRRMRPGAVFSTGGFVAGPVAVSALLARTPLVVMEPNAVPGFANRKIGKRVYRALLGFEEAKNWFPASKSEVTGLPVRPEFFSNQPKQGGRFTVLITGGSQGSRTLNRAARESWPVFRESGSPLRIIHQTGASEYEGLAAEFRETGLEGDVVPFIRNMPAAFREADLVVGRAGAGAVNEIAAAGMASVLVPFPFAADDHQRRNAEAMSRAGAARMVLDAELSGERLFAEIESLRKDPESLGRMRENVKRFARRGAAERAADVLEEAATKR